MTLSRLTDWMLLASDSFGVAALEFRRLIDGVVKAVRPASLVMIDAL